MPIRPISMQYFASYLAAINVIEEESMKQDDWQSCLSNEISNRTIVVHESDKPWFKTLTHRFPVSSSGICWEQVPGAKFCSAWAPNISTIDMQARILEFFMQFGKAASLTDEDTCIVIGDITTSIAIEVSYKVLLTVLLKLVTEPQSLYVIVKNGDWCFVYTFEDYMYFAKSPQ